MLEAAWWGFVGGAALLVGALLGLYLKVGLRVIGLVMAFGAGVLISAVAFELHRGGVPVGRGHRCRAGARRRVAHLLHR